MGDITGRLQIYEGPQRIWLSRCQVRFLDRFIANQHQYLEVSLKKGEKQHMPGPASLWLNPSIHSQIKVKDAINLDSSEALVVYTDRPALGKLASKDRVQVDRAWQASYQQQQSQAEGEGEEGEEEAVEVVPVEDEQQQSV